MIEIWEDKFAPIMKNYPEIEFVLNPDVTDVKIYQTWCTASEFLSLAALHYNKEGYDIVVIKSLQGHKVQDALYFAIVYGYLKSENE